MLLERGYSRFRIADAAAKAKVSRGGQTHHYATKNDLIEAAIEHLFAGEVGQTQAEAASAEDDEIFRTTAQHADDFFSSKLFQVSLNMLISMDDQEQMADGVRAISARSRAPIEAAWVNRIAKLGVDIREAETVLTLLWSVQRGFSIGGRIEGVPTEAAEGALEFTIDLLEEYFDDIRSRAA